MIHPKTISELRNNIRLYDAASVGDLDQVKSCMEQGAVYIVDAVEVAASMGHLNVVKYMLESNSLPSGITTNQLVEQAYVAAYNNRQHNINDYLEGYFRQLDTPSVLRLSSFIIRNPF